jgi:hypothetical protein
MQPVTAAQGKQERICRLADESGASWGPRTARSKRHLLSDPLSQRSGGSEAWKNGSQGRPTPPRDVPRVGAVHDYAPLTGGGRMS